MGEGMAIGPYEGAMSKRFAGEGAQAWLGRLPAHLDDAPQLLSQGRNRVVCLDGFPGPGGEALPVVAKCFGSQSRLKDRFDRHHGSRARRSWIAAEHLLQHGVGTPAPVAYLDRWDRGRLVASVYVSLFSSGGLDLRRELIRLFRHEPLARHVVDLLECVAPAIRSMHDAGLLHRDLGNQNIRVRTCGPGGWHGVEFIDLNRAQIHPRLSLAHRARDLSRLHLPSDLLRILFEIYFGASPPAAFVRAEARYRRRYALHGRTRRIRHPLRRGMPASPADPDLTYPPFKELWIWDDRSSQPINVLRRKDRNRLHGKRSVAGQAMSAARALPGVHRRYRRLLKAAYTAPVEMAGRVGVAVEAGAERDAQAERWLDGLGPVPALVRLYHHGGSEQWAAAAACIRRLGSRGHPVAAALVQDRVAVREPDRWRSFLAQAVADLGADVEWFEVGHAVNRVKWGVWDLAEYRRLLEPLAELRRRYPGVRFMGPAVIDFEWPYAAAALDRVPPGAAFDALSSHLYVDRRGAPENCQGQFDTLRKCAWLRALANRSTRCAGRLIVSEVNWPLRGTGVYSPVVSPYDTPGPRSNDPSVGEPAYAAFLVRYLLIALASGLVERVYWWRLAARGFGLLDDTEPGAWRARPAYTALCIFLREIGAATFTRRIEADRGVVYFLFRRGDGSMVATAHTVRQRAEVAPPFRLSRLTDSAGHRREPCPPRIEVTGDPVYLDIVPGEEPG